MNKRLSNQLSQLYNSDKLPWIIISIGIILRLNRYIYNPPLYFDESNIALDIIQRPISDIFNPSPDYTQAYPYAFLALIKLLTQALGNSEYVVRLFPLLSGIGALFLFYKIIKHYITPKAVLIALALFAFLDPLIFESSNLKPYSSDVFFTLLLYALTIYVQARELSISRTILFGIFGALAVWFSNPSVFVLAGIGICLLLYYFNENDWSRIRKLSVVYLIWILSFMANYFYYIQNLQASFGMKMEEMLSFEKAYMPIPPKSLTDIKWFITLFFDIFNYPLAMTLTGISAIAFIIGCISIYYRNRRSFFLLTSPIIVTFIAAALHEYIFRDRFILFLLPLMLLIIAEGAEYMRSKTVQSSKIIGIIFIVLLFFHPLSLSAYRTIKPIYYEDSKSILKYVKDNWQKGDILYVHYFAQYQFEYYSEYSPEPYRFDKSEYIIGIAPRGWYRRWKKADVYKYYDNVTPVKQSSMEIFKVYARDLGQLQGNKRVWFLFARAIPKDGINEEKFFVYTLENMGKQLDFFGIPGVSTCYLYDLS